MNSRGVLAAAVVLALVAMGAALQPVADTVRRAAGGPEPALAPAGLDAALGRGVSVAVLGGYRGLAADLLWLETYVTWTARDRPTTTALIRLVTSIDERPESFWLNGARIIAYDLAQWRLAEAARGAAASPAECRRIRHEQADAAVELLARARRWHPRSAAICIELGNIELVGRGDLAAAARWYRAAAELPRAPHYAARVYAELLRRQGRPAEAYAWLRRIHPALPPGDPEAMPEAVLARIRELETELGVPAADRYRSAGIDEASQRGQKEELTGFAGKVE